MKINNHSGATPRALPGQNLYIIIYMSCLPTPFLKEINYIAEHKYMNIGPTLNY